MKLIYLSNKFRSDYPRSKFPELMDKDTRPYCCVAMKVEGKTYAIPLRHHIKHPFAFYTTSEAGLDYTKAVVIDDPDYIAPTQPIIDSSEWSIIRTNENTIFFEFRKYIKNYKRAAAHPDNPRSEIFLRYSTLKYFDI